MLSPRTRPTGPKSILTKLQITLLSARRYRHSLDQTARANPKSTEPWSAPTRRRFLPPQSRKSNLEKMSSAQHGLKPSCANLCQATALQIVARNLHARLSLNRCTPNCLDGTVFFQLVCFWSAPDTHIIAPNHS